MKFRSILVFLFCSLSAYPQSQEFIRRLELKVDTHTYVWPDDRILINQQMLLPFSYRNEEEICEIRVWTTEGLTELELMPAFEYELIDSLIYTGEVYRFKIRFLDLTRQDFLKFAFRFKAEGIQHMLEIPLQATTKTTASLYLRDNTLFIGEEKIFEIQSGNPDNILINPEWVVSPAIDYRLSRIDSRIYLHLIPNQLGEVVLRIPLQTRKPSLSSSGKPSYEMDPLELRFAVKSGRLQYLNFSPREIILSEKTKSEGIEVELDYSRIMQMEKTYRIENREEKGGALIAELFTRRKLANNKVLCTIHPYNYHGQSEGYLYIKDGDDVRFITNLRVSHEPSIETISILREGGQWISNRTIYPGETFEIRIEGKGLHKARFRFEDLIDLTTDTITRSESQLLYKLKVPMDIRKNTIAIYNHQQNTGQTLKISEYQRPREFDYVYINYGDIGRRVSGLRGPVFYQKTVKDVVLSFNDDHIDMKDNLYGKQYFDLDVRITGKRNELVEMRTIRNIVICPDKSSPRYAYYSGSNCRTENLSLNKYLSRKTYDLDEWSKISLTLKTDETKYAAEGYEKEIDIILKRTYSFDIEVSFPAGLITISRQDDGEIGFGSLSGISMAMIAQFSFYHPEKIATYRPYKIGAGFLAFNAFNFSENVDNRDVGIVLLGSLYPTKRDLKLSFPLYVGGGYFLKDQKWFFLVGPGIRVRL